MQLSRHCVHVAQPHECKHRNNAVANCRRQRHFVKLRASEPDQAAASTQEVALSQALTAIGLSGTLAVSGAALCGINLFGLFHWERLQDIQLALELNSILILLDAALFVPGYSIPNGLLEQQQTQQRSNQQVQQPQQQQQQQQQGYLDMLAVSSCSAWAVDSWRLMLAMLRPSLRGPQLQQRLPLQVACALLVGCEGSKELLQRGFFLTALAGWLSDRLYEADVGGIEGLVALPGLGVQVPELALLAASLAATALFAPSAYLAAEEAAESVSGAMLLQTEPGSVVAAAAAAAAGATAASGSKAQQQGPAAAASTSSSSSTAGGSGSDGHAQQQTDDSLQQPPAGPTAGGDAEGAEEVEEDLGPLDPEVLEYRLVKVTQACLTSAPVQLAYRLTLAKELGRLMLANTVFVLTQQNLAASFSSSLVANALLLAYARTGQPQQQ